MKLSLKVNRYFEICLICKENETQSDSFLSLCLMRFEAICPQNETHFELSPALCVRHLSCCFFDLLPHSGVFDALLLFIGDLVRVGFFLCIRKKATTNQGWVLYMNYVIFAFLLICLGSSAHIKNRFVPNTNAVQLEGKKKVYDHGLNPCLLSVPLTFWSNTHYPKNTGSLFPFYLQRLI